MVGKVESLNASVAGSIALAAARQARLDAAERRRVGEADDDTPQRPDALQRLGALREADDEDAES
jgi:DNA-binding IclR family transcriptional regulator